MCKRGIDGLANIPDHCHVDFEVWPKDPVAAAALVALVLADIGDRDERDMQVLLYSFVRTAWPSQRCQNQ